MGALGWAALLSLAADCGRDVHPVTTAAIIQVEDKRCINAHVKRNITSSTEPHCCLPFVYPCTAFCLAFVCECLQSVWDDFSISPAGALLKVMRLLVAGDLPVGSLIS